MKRNLLYPTGIIVFAIMFLVPAESKAQRDTSKKTTIDINSSFKPVLRQMEKRNFKTYPMRPDTTISRLKYETPGSELQYSYQPPTPVAVDQQPDSNIHLGRRNFVKLGYGNLSTPYASAGFSFGDGRKRLLNAYGSYISSKGQIRHQDYSILELKAQGSYFGEKNELYGGMAFQRRNLNLYGYDHVLYKFDREDVRQQFMDMSVNFGMRNKTIGEYGISYDPKISISHFINRDKLSETTVSLNAPISKEFLDVFTFKTTVRADYTHYATRKLPSGDVKYNNTVVQVAPGLVYTKPNLVIHAGIAPTWDNGKFVWLPDVKAEFGIPNNSLRFMAGWVGDYKTNSFRNLSAVNPYIAPLRQQQNTTEVEFYGGVKTSFLKHFSVNAKVGLVQYRNLPFFINDTATDGKAFLISNESSVSDLRLHGDISYVNGERLNVTAGITFNGYTLMKDNARAWNTVPMEFTSSVRWLATKQIMFKADFNAFGAGFYLDKGNQEKVFKPGAELSAGAEFKLSKTFSAWLDVNNILNNKYQRWHNYEVYGLNLVGGLKKNF